MSARTELLRLAALAGLAAMLAARHRERRVVGRLRDGTPIERLDWLERRALRRLVRNGAATLLDAGRYALIPDGYAALRRRRRKRALLIIVALALVLLILWRRGIFA